MSGKVYTFYSYKGGVGRTMALANIGTLLSIWGKKVLMIDWDLEAPGLENYFKSGNERLLDQLKNKDGLIDLIFRRKQNKEYLAESIHWKDHISQLINYSQQETSKGKLDLLHAGKKDQGYIARVRELDYGSFYEDQEGGAYFEAMREYWISQYDIILIDSRTGLTDSGGVCSIQMPDALVMLFTATDQGYAGTIQIADRAIEAQKNIIYDRYALKIIPVPTRFDSTEFKLQRDWLEKIETGLTKIYQTWVPEYPKEDSINIDLRKILELTKLPYIPYFSYGEKLPVIEEGTSNPQGLGYAYETLAAILVHDLEGAKLLSENRTEYVRRAIKGEDPYKKERELPATLQPADKSNTYIKYGLIGAVGLLLVVMLAQNLFFQEKNKISTYVSNSENETEILYKLKYSELETEYVKLDTNSTSQVVELNKKLISSGLFFDTGTIISSIKQTIAVEIQQAMEYTIPNVYYEIGQYYGKKKNKSDSITRENPFDEYFTDPIKKMGPYETISRDRLHAKFSKANIDSLSNTLVPKTIQGFLYDTTGFSMNYIEEGNYFYTKDSFYVKFNKPDTIQVHIHFTPELKIDSLIYLTRKKQNNVPVTKIIPAKSISFRVDFLVDRLNVRSKVKAEDMVESISQEKKYISRVVTENKYIKREDYEYTSDYILFYNPFDKKEAEKISSIILKNIGKKIILKSYPGIPVRYLILSINEGMMKQMKR